MGALRGLVPYPGIVLGTAITATGLNLFLIPNRLNDGGLTGVAVVLHFVAGWPVGLTLLVLNLPLLAVASYLVGVPFGVKTLLGAVSLAVLLEVIPVHPVTHDLLLGAVYGGILSGAGLGLVFRASSSTGGTDLVARILRHYFHTSMGFGLMGADILVIGLTAGVMGIRLAMYSLFALFVGTRIVDVVQVGLDYHKSALIIARDPEQLARRILQDLGRGVTGWTGRGMYTGEPRTILLTAVSRMEIPRLKAIVYRHDPQAFFLIQDAYEVLGEGFQTVGPDGKPV